MANSVSNINCNFCGLTQAPSQPHCAGCGAALPLRTGKHQVDEKMLALATQVNSLLARENNRVNSRSRVTQMRLGIGMIGIGIVVVIMVGGSSMRSTVIAEHEMKRDRAVQQRYTRALEMELYNAADGSRPIDLPR